MNTSYQPTSYFLTTTESVNQGISGEVGRDVFIFSDENNKALFEITCTYPEDDNQTDSLTVKQLSDVNACDIPKMSGALHLGYTVLSMLDDLMGHYDCEFYGDVFEHDTDKGVLMHF